MTAVVDSVPTMLKPGAVSDSTAASPETRPDTTIEDIVRFGRMARDKEDFETAAANFCSALTKKIEECNGDQLNSALGPFFLNYGDALLSCEETSAAILIGETTEGTEVMEDVEESEAEEADQDAKPETTKTETPATNDEEPSVLQLAYENLSIAALLLVKNYEAIRNPTGKQNETAVEACRLASLANFRLGDLAMMEKKTQEAVKAYSMAIELRKSAGMHYTTIYNLMFHVAHALEYEMKYEEALPYLLESVAMLQRHINGEDAEAPGEDKMSDFQANLRNWKQMLDICRHEIELNKRQSEKVKGMANASSQIGFDSAKLSTTEPVDLTTKIRKRTNDNTEANKKPKA